MKSLYKRIDSETAAWDCDAHSRRYVSNNHFMRKMRKRLRRMARKRINKFFT